MLQIIEFQKIESDKWDSYVYQHPQGTIFQSVAYLACHSSLFHSKCFGFAAVEGGDIVGLVSGVISYNYSFPFNYLTRRAVIEGGPLANDPQIAEQLIAAVARYTRRRAIYTQYRNLWDLADLHPVMEKHGYEYEPHLDIIHDLSIEKEDIIKNISKNKRGNVHKSINKGLVFREAKETEWNRCVDLVLGTYQRVGLPCQSRSYFMNAFKTMSENIKVFVVELDNSVIGTRVELCFKGLIYDWYAGADDNYRNYYPNDVLPYSILLWGKDNNYKYFDFGGAGRPDVPYGVREHKLKFGGELVEFGRYSHVSNSLLYSLGSWGIKMLKRLKH